MLRLKTFGQPVVERDGRPVGGAAQQRRVIALLALIAAGRGRGVSRDRLLGLLWSEREPEKARQSLTQSLYHARKAVGQDDLFFATADLRLNPDVIDTDFDDFANALDRGDLARAVDLYHGPFLDGFHLSDAPEFERWVSEERATQHERVVRALEQLAAEATAAGDFPAGSARWKQLAALEPLNSRIAIELMRALARAGDRAGAIRYAEIHATLLREQLDVTPHPAIAALVEELRAEPLWVPPVAPAPAPARDNPDPSVTGAELPNAEPALAGRHGRGRTTRWWQRYGIAIVAGVAVIAVALAGIARWISSASQTRRSGDLVVVAPFRVSGADPSLAFLREGLVDLLVTSLGDDQSGVADPGAVLNAWRRVGYTEAVDLARDRAIDMARRLGATRLLTGSVVGAPNHLVVNAALIAVPDGRVRAQASADGPADSITMIVDRLVVRLLAKEAGEWERLASHTSSSPQALRAYLDGQVAYRRGRYNDAVRSFRRALERDPSFAMAGLGLATAAERIDAGEERSRGLRAAWAARSELTMRDSVFLQALVGPRYPDESSPREYLTAWERAATVVGDRSDVWHELGERLFYDGQALGMRDWAARAKAAFRRAAALDATFASPMQYLVQLAAADSDTASVRAAANTYLELDSTGGELAAFVRWRAAVALDDDQALARLRATIPKISTASLKSIALSSQYNGIALGDGERAVDALAARAARGAERADALLARHSLALNRGDTRDALEATEMLGEDRSRAALAARLRVTDYLYAGADSAAAAQAAEWLRRHLTLTTMSTASAARPADDLTNACVVRQWRAWLSTTPALDSGTTLPLQASIPGSSSASGLCGALADAIEAASARSTDAMQRAAHVDSLSLVSAPDDELRDYLGLALARVWDALGDDRKALDAVRRRPYMRRWPHYLAAHLEMEGRISESLGDSASAVAAYTRYLHLRRSPDAHLRAEAAAARAAIARLSARPDAAEHDDVK